VHWSLAFSLHCQPSGPMTDTPPGAGARMSRSAVAFLGSVAVSSVGDGFRYAALPLLLALYGASPAVLGLLLAVGTAPFLLIGLLGGALADRCDRLTILRVADLARFAAGALFVVLLALGTPHAVVILAAFVLAFVMGAGEALSYPAMFALVPAISGPDGLAKLNGRIGACQTVGQNMIGPLAGSAVVPALGMAPFLADALSFAASWCLLSRVDRNRLAVAPPPPRRLRAEILDGFRWLRTQPILMSLTATSALVNLANMGFLSTQALYAINVVHSPAIGYGALMASASAGGTVTALAVGRIIRRDASLRIVPTACAILAVGMLVLALANQLIVAMGGALCCGAGYALYNVTVMTARQQLTPDQLRGRVSSLGRSVSWGVLPLGSLGGGLLASTVGLRAPAAFTAIAALAATGWILWATARWRMRTEAVPAPD
jgi:MFS family permease